MIDYTAYIVGFLLGAGSMIVSYLIYTLYEEWQFKKDFQGEQEDYGDYQVINDISSDEEEIDTNDLDHPRILSVKE